VSVDNSHFHVKRGVEGVEDEDDNEDNDDDGDDLKTQGDGGEAT